MTKCPYCDRNLRFWRFRCRLCNRFVWRIPQILIVLASVSVVILTVFIIVDYVALSTDPYEKKNGAQPGAVRERPSRR